MLPPVIESSILTSDPSGANTSQPLGSAAVLKFVILHQRRSRLTVRWRTGEFHNGPSPYSGIVSARSDPWEAWASMIAHRRWAFHKQSIYRLTFNQSVEIMPRMTVGPPTARSSDDAGEDLADAVLDRVFFALSDPVRRRILDQLDEEAKLVSELAAPFDISLQAVSRHIQVLVRAGLLRQERTGRIARCSLVAGPIATAAVWINRYSKYWQEQFDMLAAAIGTITDDQPDRSPQPTPKSARKTSA